MQSTMAESEQQTTGTETKRTARCIDVMPLGPLEDFTPARNPAHFEQAVQDHCRTSRSGYQVRSSLNSSDKCQQMAKSTSQLLSNRMSPAISTKGSAVRSCKVIISGDVAVGKTCLFNRFGRDIYSNQYQTTIGVDFDIQRFTILGQHYLLQLWDTAGLERFRCITSSYYRGCQAALLLFDMSNLSTLANVLKWKDEVLRSAKTFEQLVQESNVVTQTPQTANDIDERPPPAYHESMIHANEPLLFLVGTKSDLLVENDAKRAFITEQANKIAALLQAELWFVSSRTGHNVCNLFNRIAALCFQRCIQAEIQRARFEASTLGTNLKEKIIQQQRDLWNQSTKLIKITKKKDGDERRSRCVNVQCVIK